MTSRADDTYKLGLDLHRNGRLAEAWVAYRQVLELRPDHGHALHQLGIIALQNKRADLAEPLIGKAARLESTSAEIHVSRGNALLELERFEAAVASYDRAIKLRPDLLEAQHNRGAALKSLGRLEAALASFERAIALQPGLADAHNNRGIVLGQLGRHEEALASLDRAIGLRGGFADAYINRGVVLAALKKHEEALASYDLGLARNPRHADAHNNRGNALRELKRHEEALASFDAAIALDPGHAVAFDNRGLVLMELRRQGEALASFDRAIALRPDYAPAHSNRGNVLRAMRLPDLALASYDNAIAADSDHAGAHHNRANALSDLNRHEQAIAAFDRALELDPECIFLRGARLHSRLSICDWGGFEADVAALIDRVEEGKAECAPFSFALLSGSPRLQLKVAQAWTRAHHRTPGVQHPAPEVPSPMAPRTAPGKLKVGYFSADFRDHPVSVLAARLFELHDRSRFEWIGFSFGPDTGDPMRKRIEAAFDRFIDVQSRSDDEIAHLARSEQIDIAVDLNGYTQDCRPGIFERRAAALQVAYLGYPGTMGAPFMDYLVADSPLIPRESRAHYDEKIIYLPHSYLPGDSERRIADRVFGREELGLPAAGVVFCCFNNCCKITPAIFDVWMRILARVEGSVLWLSECDPKAMENLRREAPRRGVAGERLIFADRLPSVDEHLARHRAADLFLDTLPYNAHATASDALWAGLPLLTCAGEAFAGRVGTSLLTTLGLPELIAADLEQYEGMAIELAKNAGQLAAIRNRLEERRLSSPLFDTRLLARHLERAYSIIHERHQAQEPAATVHVPPSASSVA